MSKVLSYALVHSAILDALQAEDRACVEQLGDDLAALAILNIYMVNDICTGFGQDFVDNASVISSRRRISFLKDGHMSFYQSDMEICQYTSLEDDINQIIMVFDAAIQRWEAQI